MYIRMRHALKQGAVMKKTQRILLVFLTVLALFLLFALTTAVSAASEVGYHGSLMWQLVEDTGALYIYGNDEMAPPADGETYPWLRRADEITSVIINYDVYSIGEGAFAGCWNLTTVTIGESVMAIGAEAFYGCDSLSTVTIHSPHVAEDLTDIYACGELIAHANKVYVMEGISLSPDFFTDNYPCISISTTPDYRYTLYSKSHSITTTVLGTDGSRFETKCINGCGYTGEMSTIIQGGTLPDGSVIVGPEGSEESGSRSRTTFFAIIAVMTVGSVLASVVLNRKLARRKYQ
jgi:hypothetical protein